MRQYCTYFDRNYLTRGLALYRSLVQHEAEFRLWVLCLDDEALRILRALDLPQVLPVALSELESVDTALVQARPTRSRVEYFFTMTPCWIRYLMPEVASGEWLTYLDADLYFYGSPEPVFDELSDASVGIIAHRFPERLRHLERHGIYNVGFLAFRQDQAAEECLGRWREQCLEWCYDRVEDGRFGDQKYLDAWPTECRDVHVIEHPGAGLAPWNFSRYAISPDRAAPMVDGKPLVFYHFHALKLLNRFVYDPGLTPYGEMDRRTRRFLYGGYVRELKRTARWVRGVAGDVPLGASIRTGPGGRSLLIRSVLSRRAKFAVG